MRVIGLDVARALAILGMMFVNYMLVFQVSSDDEYVSFLQLFEGRSAALFVILAGVGLTLWKGRATQLVKRSLFLFVLGLLLYTVFEWSADILHYYALFIVCAIPFLTMNRRRIAAAIVLVSLTSLMMHMYGNYQFGWVTNEALRIV